jgi:hypothetical protein
MYDNSTSYCILEWDSKGQFLESLSIENEVREFKDVTIIRSRLVPSPSSNSLKKKNPCFFHSFTQLRNIENRNYSKTYKLNL